MTPDQIKADGIAFANMLINAGNYFNRPALVTAGQELLDFLNSDQWLAVFGAAQTAVQAFEMFLQWLRQMHPAAASYVEAGI